MATRIRFLGWLLTALLAAGGVAIAEEEGTESKNGSEGKPAAEAEEPVDPITALKLAGVEGDTRALLELGDRHMTGDGVVHNYSIAWRWYMMAAEKDEPEALYKLGMMYMRGQGVPLDHGEAVAWLGKAVDLGHEEAAAAIDHFYRVVRPSPIDVEKWRKAAREARQRIAEEAARAKERPDEDESEDIGGDERKPASE